MAQFEPRAEEIEKIGSLVYVAAQRRGGIVADPVKYFEKHPVKFPFLLDEERAVTKAYGIHQRLGMDAINIARPATFVLDRNGIVRFLYFGKNKSDRAPIDKVIAALKTCQ